MKSKFIGALVFICAMLLLISPFPIVRTDSETVFSVFHNGTGFYKSLQYVPDKNIFTNTAQRCLMAATKFTLATNLSLYTEKYDQAQKYAQAAIEKEKAEKIRLEQATAAPVKKNPGKVLDIASKQTILKPNFHNGKPKVLIYHTHTTESYMTDTKSNVYRSKNPKISVLLVGNILSRVLSEEYGIEVLHDTVIYDIPYDEAYDKTMSSVEKHLKKYPSIQYVFDVHRDGLANNKDNFSVYSTKVRGVSACRVMLVLGDDSPYKKQNTAFAGKLKNRMEKMYPGLYKKTLHKPYKFNQHFHPNSLLLEVGCNLTSPDEARASASFLGRCIGECINPSD